MCATPATRITTDCFYEGWEFQGTLDLRVGYFKSNFHMTPRIHFNKRYFQQPNELGFLWQTKNMYVENQKKFQKKHGKKNCTREPKGSLANFHLMPRNQLSWLLYYLLGIKLVIHPPSEEKVSSYVLDQYWRIVLLLFNFVTFLPLCSGEADDDDDHGHDFWTLIGCRHEVILFAHKTIFNAQWVTK